METRGYNIEYGRRRDRKMSRKNEKLETMGLKMIKHIQGGKDD